MDKKQAEEIKNKIVAISKDAGLWVEIQEVHKPDLKDIIITVSVRIDSEKTITFVGEILPSVRRKCLGQK